MKLPFSSLLTKEHAEYILALLLRDETIHVVIFEQEGTMIRLAVHHKVALEESIESISFEKLLQTLDKAISLAEEHLPEGSILKKTVFGVKQNWTEDAKIKREYLVTLKKVSEELDLHPIGFLVFAEAIAHLLQKEEGAPVSALLVEAGKRNTIVTMLRAGRLGEAHTMENIDGQLTKTVDTLLKHFENVEILPSRIILFEAVENKKVDQTFISHSWSKSLPFLHMPQVTVLPPGFDTKAVLYGTAAQLGLDVDETHEGITVQGHSSEKQEEKEQESKQEEETHATIERVTPMMTPESFGFALDRDVAQDETEKAVAEEKETPVAEKIAEIPEEVKEKTTGEKEGKETLPSDGMLLFSGFKKMFTKKETHTNVPVEESVSYQQKPQHVRSPWRVNKLVVVLFIISIIGIASVYAYMQLIKATVTITVKPKIVELHQDITLSTSSGSDFAKNMLSGSVVSFTEDGTLNTPATGTKDVGDPAKGTLTIYNRTADPITVVKGATVTSANGLKFTLDQNVTIASASGLNDPTVSLTPGTAHAPVTASSFGTESNLPSNTKFTIGNNTSIAAKNDNPFSGGTKKQITTVAKNDIDKLTGDLTKQLESKAKDDLANKSSQDKKVLPVFIKEAMTKKDFDKKAGDETKTLTLQATMSFDAISYDKHQFDDYARYLIKDKLTSDVTLASNGLTYDLQNSKQKNDKEASVTMGLKAKLLPKIDKQKIADQIKGKSFADATSQLTATAEIANVSLTLHPNLFFLPKILPRNQQNITVVTNTND